VYQASWYWYYGIDIARLNVPLPVILQQSWMLSTIILGVLLALFGILFLLRLIALSARSLFLRDRRIELASLFSIYDIFRRNFHVVVLVYLALLHEFLVGISTHNDNYFTLEMPAAVTTLDTLIIPIAFVLSIRLLGDFLFPTRQKIVCIWQHRVVMSLPILLVSTCGFIVCRGDDVKRQRWSGKTQTQRPALSWRAIFRSPG
jgi:hypothetical protein